MGLILGANSSYCESDGPRALLTPSCRLIPLYCWGDRIYSSLLNPWWVCFSESELRSCINLPKVASNLLKFLTYVKVGNVGAFLGLYLLYRYVLAYPPWAFGFKFSKDLFKDLPPFALSSLKWLIDLCTYSRAVSPTSSLVTSSSFSFKREFTSCRPKGFCNFLTILSWKLWSWLLYTF